MTAQHPAAPETEHTPVDVYEMPDESAESLHARIEAGTAVLAFRVCEKCAPTEVLERIEDGDLDLSDGDALAAQWPCEFVTPAAPETDANGLTEAECQSLAEAVGKRVSPHGFLAIAVERIVAERVRVVEGERDAEVAEAEREHEKTLAIMEAACDRSDAATLRAESAEAAHERLRAGVEALADEWEADQGRTWIASLADDLRALLAGGGKR